MADSPDAAFFEEKKTLHINLFVEEELKGRYGEMVDFVKVRSNAVCRPELMFALN